MINLLKPKEQIIEEIHSAFDSAPDRLLKEANNAIKRINLKGKQKADALKAAGFTGSELVQKIQILEKQLHVHEEKANFIEHYKRTYPFQKFLTEKELDKICNKYGLIYAPISRYKKTVPDKNLQDIRNAKALSSVDFPENTFTITQFTYRYSQADEIKEFKKKYKGKMGEFPKKFLDGSTWPIFDDGSIRLYVDVRIIERSNSLFIAAPKSHFNLKGLKKSKLGFFTFKDIKDPIVFRYVKGGIQVLTKWGDEAEDEMLINPLDN